MTQFPDPSHPHGSDRPAAYPSQPAPGSWPAQGAPPLGASQQAPPASGSPGAPASPQTGLRLWHLVLAAVLALLLGGVGGFAGGFYVLGGGVTGSEAQELRDRIAELEGQVSDLEEELTAAGGSDGADAGDDANGGDTGTGTDTGTGPGAGGPVRIGVPTGWAETMAASHVWQQVLETNGYEVEIVELSDLAVVYVALANGEIDMTLGTWGPASQQYIDQHAANLEDLGSWFDEARMGIVVNDDAPITSLTELADHADEFDGEILGIEEGSGVVQMTNQAAVPAYGLDGMTVSTGSTQEMLLGIAEAFDEGNNVAATLWAPYWAFDELPIRFLEDPEGAFGEAESIHAYATTGFSAAQPELAECLAEIDLTAEQVNSMVNTVLGEDGTDDGSAAQQWLANNSGVVCDAFA